MPWANASAGCVWSRVVALYAITSMANEPWALYWEKCRADLAVDKDMVTAKAAVSKATAVTYLRDNKWQ